MAVDGNKTALDHLYAAIHRAENKVGGGEGLVGIYGSMTQQGTENIMRAMAQLAGLNQRSILLDIGSGLCRPLLHAMVQYGVCRTYGVELDAVKCQKAVPFLRHAASQLESAGVMLPKEVLPTIICASVEQLSSLDPATHAYAAWEGFPVQAKMAVGDLFVATPSLRTITIVQRSLRKEDPAEVMADLGFGSVLLLSPAIPVHMAGSHRRLNAYIFSKTSQPNTAAAKGSKQGTDAVNNQRAAGGGYCVGWGGGHQAAKPSLSTALPFDPAAVMEALARMDSSVELATSMATGQATGHRSSFRATKLADLGPKEGVGSHGVQGPAELQKPPHHHSLRSNCKRSARVLQQDAETDKGEHGEGCVDGSSGERLQEEGMCGRAQQPEGLQKILGTGLSSVPLVITTKRRSQRTSRAQRGSVVSDPTVCAAADDASGGIVGAQQGAKRRLPWQQEQEHSTSAVAMGTRAAARQAEQAGALRQHSMRQHSVPGSMGPAAYTAATTAATAATAARAQAPAPAPAAARATAARAPAPAAQLVDNSRSHRGSSSAHAPAEAQQVGSSQPSRTRRRVSEPQEPEQQPTAKRSSMRAAEGPDSAGTGVGKGVGMQMQARGAAGRVINSASDAKGMQTRARSTAGEGSSADRVSASDGKGMQTRTRSAAGTVAAAVPAAASQQPLVGPQARAPTTRGAQLPLFVMRRETKPKLAPKVATAQPETKPAVVAAQPEVGSKWPRRASAGSGHVGADKAIEPVKVSSGADCPKLGG